MLSWITCLCLAWGVNFSVAHGADTPTTAEMDSKWAALWSEWDEDAIISREGVGIELVNLDTGSQVYGRQSNKSFVPASSMKVLTAAAALKALGPSYAYETLFLTDGSEVAGGFVEGNLYVQGSGDPSLVVERLWKLVLDLRHQGIRRIGGDVVFDDSLFKGSSALPGWHKPEDIRRGTSYFATLSALSINFNTVAIVVGPGAKEGAPGQVFLETPAGEYVTLVNDTTTVSEVARKKLTVERKVSDQGMEFVLSGVLPLGSSPKLVRRTVADPTAHFMAVFQHMLGVHEITVDGAMVTGVVPKDGSVFYTHTSPALSRILMDMNKYSNNFIAEQVLRTAGAASLLPMNSTQAGLEVIRDYLTTLQIPVSDYSLVNGSGLSRKIRLRPSHLSQVLSDMYKDTDVGPEFVSSLAISGVDGTLRERLKPFPGGLRGKTGTLEGVYTIAGYVYTIEGTFSFVMLCNDTALTSAQVKSTQDRLIEGILQVTGDNRGQDGDLHQ